MDNFYEVTKEKLKKNIETLNNQPMSDTNADLYKDLTTALSNVVTACAMEEYKEEGNYSGYYSMARGNGQGGNNRGGMSGARFRMPDYDDMIPMSRDGRMGRDGDGDGVYSERRMPARYYYSGHSGKEKMMMELKAMRDDADSERERKAIDHFIEEMKEIKGV